MKYQSDTSLLPPLAVLWLPFLGSASMVDAITGTDGWPIRGEINMMRVLYLSFPASPPLDTAVQDTMDKN